MFTRNQVFILVKCSNFHIFASAREHAMCLIMGKEEFLLGRVSMSPWQPGAGGGCHGQFNVLYNVTEWRSF